jgi:hypothetical protein
VQSTVVVTPKFSVHTLQHSSSGGSSEQLNVAQRMLNHAVVAARMPGGDGVGGGAGQYIEETTTTVTRTTKMHVVPLVSNTTIVDAGADSGLDRDTASRDSTNVSPRSKLSFLQNTVNSAGSEHDQPSPIDDKTHKTKSTFDRHDVVKTLPTTTVKQWAYQQQKVMCISHDSSYDETTRMQQNIEERVITIDLNRSNVTSERPSFGFTVKGGKQKQEPIVVEAVILGELVAHTHVADELSRRASRHGQTTCRRRNTKHQW